MVLPALQDPDLNQGLPSLQDPDKIDGQYSELNVPESQTVSESQFQQAPGPTPAEQGLITQQILGNPFDPNFDPSGLKPYDYQGGVVAGAKREPGFMKMLEQWGVGGALGALKWGGALAISEMEKIVPKSKMLGTDKKSGIQEIYKALEKHASKLDQEYKGVGIKGGELVGGFAGMAIPGSLYTKGTQLLKTGVSKLAPKAGEYIAENVPAIIQKAGGFAGRTVEGTGLLGAIEGAKYEPGEGYNFNKIPEAFNSPLNIGLGAGGAIAGKYFENVRKYSEIRKDLPSAFYMDTKESGPWLSLSQMFLDAPYALAPKLTARGVQESLIKNDITKWINNISGISGAVHFKDYANFVARKIQGAVRRQNKGEKQIWEQGGFKDLPINSESKTLGSQLSQQALDVLNQSGVPLSKETKNILSKIIKTNADDPALIAIGGGTKKNITVNDIRDVQVELGRLANNYGKTTATAAEQQVSKQLKKIRNDLFQPIKYSVPKDKQTAIEAAIEFSRRKNEFFDSVPGIAKSAKNAFSAKKIALQFLKESESFSKQALAEQLSRKGMAAARSGYLAQAMEGATSKSTGKLNLSKFNESLGARTNAPEFLGTETYKAFQGIEKVLKNIHEAQHMGWLKQATMIGIGAGTLGSLGVGGAAVGGPLGATIALSYPAAMIITHNPALKKTLGHFTKNLSNSAFKSLTNQIIDKARKAGLILNTETGEITHKDEE